MADPLNLVGKAFAGYAVEKKIGAGGMGVVFRAFDERLRRVVALKILPPAMATEEETRLRFLREGRTAAKIDHENAVRLLAAGEENGLAYLVMEFVDGGSLQQRIDRYKRLPPAEVISIARQVARALGAGHRLGIMHRDVKPANVLFTREGEAKLADYGLAKEDKGEQSLSMTGMVMGTPHYMAPEVCEGKKADARSDLYALGVMMYYMAAGRYPFDADAVMQLLMAHVQDIAPPIENAPPAMADVIDRLMAKDPAKRYQNADELVAALDVAARDPGASLAGTPGGKASGVKPASGSGAGSPGGSRGSSPQPANASGMRAPSGMAATGSSSMPGNTAPLSLAAPLPVPRWHFAAYAVAGMAFLVSAALLVWVFTRDKGGPPGPTPGPVGSGTKVEQNVDPVALARGELTRKWVAFQARARREDADLEACLGEAGGYVTVDAAGVEKLRGELLARLKDVLLGRIQARGDQLATEAGKGAEAALASAAEREKWADLPFVKELRDAEDAVEIRAWNTYLDKLSRDVAGFMAKDEYRLAMDRWDPIDPPKIVGRKRIEEEQKAVWKRAKESADRAIDAARGTTGVKALRDLAKKMPKDLRNFLEQRAFDLEQAEETGNPMDQLGGMLAARDFAGVLRQLDILEESGKYKGRPQVLEIARQSSRAGKKTVDRAMDAWRALTGKEVTIQRADGTLAKGTVFEVSDANDQVTLEAGSGHDVLRLSEISAGAFADAALGPAPGNAAIADALDFALALRDRPAAFSLFRRLIRRGMDVEEGRRKALGELVPREQLAEAESRLAALRSAKPGPESADMARLFLEKFRDWPLQPQDRTVVEQILAVNAATWTPADLDLVCSGTVEQLPGGAARLTWTDDRLLEDSVGMGGLDLEGGEGLAITPKGDGALLAFPLIKWKDPRIRIEVRSTDKFFVLIPGWRSWSEGLPAALALHDGLSQSGIQLPMGDAFTPVPTKESGWYTVEISITGNQYVVTVNETTQRATLTVPWDGGVGLFLTAPLVIRSLSISGKPSWATEDVEAQARELKALIAENKESEIAAGTWARPPSKEKAVTLKAEEAEQFLKPPAWNFGPDYVIRFNGAVSGKGTTEKWPELVLDFRCGSKTQRRFYLSGKSRTGYLQGDKWQAAGLCREVQPVEMHEFALVVKGEMALLVVDGEPAWMGHTGPATSGGPAIGVRNGTLDVSELKVRGLAK